MKRADTRIGGGVASDFTGPGQAKCTPFDPGGTQHNETAAGDRGPARRDVRGEPCGMAPRHGCPFWWRHGFRSSTLRAADLLAGLTVALLMIPAVARLRPARWPARLLLRTLRASLLPTMVGALFGSLAQRSLPDRRATYRLLTAASVMTLATPGSDKV